MEGQHLTKFIETPRRLFRFGAALLFWSNAFLIVRLPTPPFAHWATRIHLTLSEAAIISTLVVLTVLRSYGVRKFSTDVAYVYFFPFILIYYFWELLFVAGKTVRYIWRRHKPNLAPPNLPELVEAEPTQGEVSSGGARRPRETGPSWTGFFRRASGLFLRFTILWGLLVIFATHKYLVQIALVLVVVHLFRALVKVGHLGWRCFNWLSNAQQNMTAYVERLFGRLGTVNLNNELTPEDQQAVSILVGIRTGLRFLPAITRLARWAVASSLWIFGAVYIYLALLFSFAYYGIARIQAISYTWPQALVTSAFIPALVGQLPRNAPLMLLGAIQWAVFAGFGLGAIMTYYNRRIAELQSVTGVVNQRLQNPAIQRALDEYEKRTRIKPRAPTGQ